jgi:serine/threonine protein kinase
MMPENFYSILEVSPRASDEVIHAAYRALALKYANTDQDKMRALNDAKEAIFDSDKRKKYDAKNALKKGKVIGQYRLLEEIAEGGFGKTYKAEHIVTGLPVCIKHASHVSPQDEQLMLEEAKSIWDLRHFGIPNVRDMFKMDDGSYALVMSYIPGPTLEKVIEKNGNALDPEHVAWITERILNVLRYIHFHGVVHGDMKVQNVIVQPESHTVVDYGLSMIRPTAKSASKGYTPFFASPEAVRGDPLIPESDFFSLGVTMIAALGGDIERRQVPKSTPEPMCDFISKLIRTDVLARPNWSKENLIDTLRDVREKSFGRKASSMKPLKF